MAQTEAPKELNPITVIVYGINDPRWAPETYVCMDYEMQMHPTHLELTVIWVMSSGAKRMHTLFLGPHANVEIIENYPKVR